jgi:hypothetical protein
MSCSVCQIGPIVSYWFQQCILSPAQVFLSTYDPATVAYFREAAARDGWALQLTDIPRLDDDPDMTTGRYAEAIGPVNEMLNSLVNLHLAGGKLGLKP